MINKDKFYETYKFEIDLFIKRSLEEDIGSIDHSTESSVTSLGKKRMSLKTVSYTHLTLPTMLLV